MLQKGSYDANELLMEFWNKYDVDNNGELDKNELKKIVQDLSI